MLQYTANQIDTDIETEDEDLLALLRQINRIREPVEGEKQPSHRDISIHNLKAILKANERDQMARNERRDEGELFRTSRSDRPSSSDDGFYPYERKTPGRYPGMETLNGVRVSNYEGVRQGSQDCTDPPCSPSAKGVLEHLFNIILREIHARRQEGRDISAPNWGGSNHSFIT